MIGSAAVPRPPKRTRANEDASNTSSSHSTPPSTPLPTEVKCERSPSPLFVDKRLVMSGTKRFTPIPDDCRPSCTEYKQNRLEWVARCVKELEALNLIPERRLFREDGLIIDWRSHVPVWSDTLQPDPQDLAATIMLAHRSNAQWRRPIRKESPPKSAITTTSQEQPASAPPNSMDVSDAEPPPKKRLSIPPRPSSKRRNNRSQLITVSFPPSEPNSPSQSETHLPSRDRTSSPSLAHHDQIGLKARARDPLNVPGIPSATEEEMSEMTLEYLRRYVQTYESDRASLASAYASNASFAYRVHHMVQNTNGPPSVWAASPKCFSSGTKRARLDIVTTLLTLPTLHSNGPDSDIARVEYDIFYLGAALGMFVVSRAVDSSKTVMHNFILQRKKNRCGGCRDRWRLAFNGHCAPDSRLRNMRLQPECLFPQV